MTPTHARLLVATTNPGKLREIAGVFDGLGFQFFDLGMLDSHLPEPIEDADTFAGNAEKKARHYAQLSGLPTLADDSGLEVDALEGRPGVHSARFAGPQRDNAANNRKLIQLLAGVPEAERTARFRCAMVLADAGVIVARTAGCIEGRIIDEPRGSGGFGYDPHFFVPLLACTTAELNPIEKNRVSHRGKALRAIARQLC